MAKEVVIVGAGPGGLASAILLAASGLKVHVLERLNVVGGRTSTFTEQGFRFDLGPTFFLYPKVLGDILATAGYDLAREVEMVKLDPQYRLKFGSGGEILATPDLTRMEQEVARLAPEDARNLRRFFADNREKFERFLPVLESPFESAADVFTPSLAKSLPWLRPWSSLDSDLGRYFRDPRVRLAFSFQSKYLGMSPFRCPSLFSILSFLEYEHGVFHPVGGCGAVSQAMARIATDLGVEIHLDEPVREVLFSGRRATGVRTDRATYPADALVMNADFARAMARLIPDRLRKRWRDKRLASKRFSCSTFMIYLGLKGRSELPHHNIYIAADYEQNLDEIENRHVLSDDPSIYVQNPGATDLSLAPRGASGLYVLAPVTHQHPNVDWKKQARPFRERVLAQVERLGFEDVERRIRYERMITPDDWSADYEVHRGAVFNLAHNLGQMLHLRPHNRFEDLDGVYLVGGGTHPGSGLPVIYQSALISSRLLLEDLGYAAHFGPRSAHPAPSPELARAV